MNPINDDQPQAAPAPVSASETDRSRSVPAPREVPQRRSGGLSVRSGGLRPYIVGVVIGLVIALISGWPQNDPLVVREVLRDKSSLEAAKAPTVVSVYDRAIKGVVTLRAVSEEGAAIQGSGFVISKEGYIATNAHVVFIPSSDEPANSTSKTTQSLLHPAAIYIDYSNGSKGSARIVGYDPTNDLALLKAIEPLPKGVQALSLADSDAVKVGEQVVAIGAPFGQQGSVSSGIVSALDRTIPALVGNFSIRDALQTDAAVNTGNSGGPLLDMHANVIGINAQINTDSDVNEGVAFAISSRTLLDRLAKLKQGGKVEYAYLGVSTAPVSAELANKVGLTASEGVLVQQVSEGSPAEKAGVKGATASVVWFGDSIGIGGDIIQAANGKRVRSPEDLVQLIERSADGASIKLTVIDAQGDKRTRTAHLTLR